MSASDSAGSRLVPMAIHVQKFLSGIDCPASKTARLDVAWGEGAEREAIHALEGLDARKSNGPTDVSRSLAGHPAR